MESKHLKSIIENEPTHFHSTWSLMCQNNYPAYVKVNWLKHFLKKDIQLEDFRKFISANWAPSLEEYKKTIHFLILKDGLEIDLEKYNWLCRENYKFYKTIEFNRDFKIWQIQRH